MIISYQSGAVVNQSNTFRNNAKATMYVSTVCRKKVNYLFLSGGLIGIMIYGRHVDGD